MGLGSRGKGGREESSDADLTWQGHRWAQWDGEAQTFQGAVLAWWEVGSSEGHGTGKEAGCDTLWWSVSAS